MFSTSSNHHSAKIVPIFPAASPSLSALFNSTPTENLQEGAVLFWEGDPSKSVFEVVDGVLRIGRLTADGRRVITGFLFPGDIVGVSFRDRHLYTAEAVVATSVRQYSKSTLQKKMEDNPFLRPTLFARLCDEMEAAQDQVMLLACRSATERVCSFMVMMSRKQKCQSTHKCTIELPMIRQDIADYLGLTIETVSRTFTRLTNDGIIVPNGPHKYDVDLRKLGHIAGDDEWSDNSPSPMNRGMAR